MGYDLKVFDNKRKEIEFLATKGGKSFLIQVAYSVVDEKHMVENLVLLLI